VAQAKARFRTLRFEQLTFDALRTNAPDPRLGGLAAPAALGDCDAFISHSWHDDAEAKWRALLAWRRDFHSAHGREPTIWFDRCCIDQTNVDSDLRCLPIFLKGCRRLVVFCGETYLSRLWCIIEIFTYVHMGGLVEDVQVQAVVRAGREEEDFQSIMQTFSCFDVAACRCFNAEDKHRLLAMVDVAYGSTHVFNTVIRGIVSFVHMSIHREISASRSFAATGCSSNPELEIKTE